MNKIQISYWKAGNNYYAYVTGDDSTFGPFSNLNDLKETLKEFYPNGIFVEQDS